MTIAVLGAGQLGRMLGLAGAPMGMGFRFLGTSADACAGAAGELVVADSFEDEAAIARVCAGADVVTYEFENIPMRALEVAAGFAPVQPSPRALGIAQDRVREKEFFHGLGAATPGFLAVSSRADLDAAAAALGLPMVLKTRRFGYDGKGQRVIRSARALDGAWAALGAHPGGLIAEQFVRFSRELSVIGVRGRDGTIALYPITENVHRDGILRTSFAPAPGVSDGVIEQARGVVTGALEALDYVGVLAVELFEVDGGDGGGVMVNEMACRVHNSGHWTMDGAVTGQFENHLRAVAGMALGSTAMRGGVICAGMVNLVGDHPGEAALSRVEGARVHLYGKAAKAGRKVGHVNFAMGSASSVRASMGVVGTMAAR